MMTGRTPQLKLRKCSKLAPPPGGNPILIMIMFGSFLPSLLAGCSTTTLLGHRSRKPALC